MIAVRWSLNALNDLYSIHARIAINDTAAAQKVVKTIYDACGGLALFPERGRASRMKGRRELIISSLPYLAVYRVTNEAVEISHIYHFAQNR